VDGSGFGGEVGGVGFGGIAGRLYAYVRRETCCAMRRSDLEALTLFIFEVGSCEVPDVRWIGLSQSSGRYFLFFSGYATE
jgi:hypothetical protein